MLATRPSHADVQALDELPRQAATLLDARAAAILLARGSQLELTHSFGLSAAYGDRLRSLPPLEPGQGPSGLAVDTDDPVVFEDVVADPRTRPWAGAALAEGYRAMAAIGLRSGEVKLGALTIYRSSAGPWPARDLELIGLIGSLATHAVRAANVIRGQQARLAAQARLTAALRAQSHEHANRIHALSLLLALGRTDDAREFADRIAGDYASEFVAISQRITLAPLAALIVGARMNAQRRGVRVELTPDTALVGLPVELREADVLTIVGNLLDNAVEEVAGTPRAGRAVTLRIRDDGAALTIEVGNPVRAETVAPLRALSASGYTTKPGHAGLGLSLVEAAASAASGRLDLRVGAGVVFRVTIPHA